MANRIPVRIVEVECLTDAVLSIQLEGIGKVPLPAWKPGAHVDLALPSGRQRQYSLCGDPTDLGRYTVAVLREGGGRGGSKELHEIAANGVELTIAGPRNNFEFVESPAYLFIAGGIGITPMLPMIREAHARGADWRLVYGGRSRSSMSFLHELASYPSDRVSIVAEIEVGFPDLETEVKTIVPGTHIYCCGPAPMLTAIEAACDRAGVSDLHLERFNGEGLDPIDSTGDSFVVEMARSGHQITVGEDQTILAAVQAFLPNPSFSCEEGYCGTCETAVLEGIPDHRDTFLTEDERADNDTIMICVSRSKTCRLKLDL